MSLWREHGLSNRAARRVAYRLRGWGYKVTIKDCEKHTPTEIAGALEPLDENKRARVCDFIRSAEYSSIPTGRTAYDVLSILRSVPDDVAAYAISLFMERRNTNRGRW